MEDKGLIFGRNPVLEYLKNAPDASPMELYISESAHGKIIDAIFDAASVKKIRAERRDREFFSRLGPSSRHQGVALRLPPDARDHGIGPGSLIERVSRDRGILVLLDHITDPHNAGSIIRTSEALGCGGVIIPRSQAAGITPSMVKASAGATAHIDIIEVSNIASFIDEAKEAGFWIIGTDDGGSTSVHELERLRPCVVVIGSEGDGMRRLTAEKCDYIVRIPLAGKVSSLNASVAAGIVLYEITRK